MEVIKLNPAQAFNNIIYPPEKTPQARQLANIIYISNGSDSTVTLYVKVKKKVKLHPLIQTRLRLQIRDGGRQLLPWRCGTH